ncbi:MAG: 2'-5' RNA ligase family protein [Actinomycetota bacterium]
MERAPALFVALRVPADVATMLVAQLGPLDPAVLRPSHPADLHLTLHYLGPVVPDPVVEALSGALADRPPVEVVLGPELVELGNAVAVTATGADELAAVVRSAVVDLGLPPRFDTFVGHVTVGRWRPGRRSSELLARTVDAALVAESVDLLASPTEPTGVAEMPGPRYDAVANWPLGPS